MIVTSSWFIEDDINSWLEQYPASAYDVISLTLPAIYLEKPKPKGYLGS